MAENEPSKPRWTPVFERISDEKRKRVLESAKAAFARGGAYLRRLIVQVLPD